jgi:hypothetical protein
MKVASSGAVRRIFQVEKPFEVSCSTASEWKNIPMVLARDGQFTLHLQASSHGPVFFTKFVALYSSFL